MKSATIQLTTAVGSRACGGFKGKDIALLFTTTGGG
ncbi:hypothetical protein A2U01_0104050, partial [Trifolium medium]|nr:hypothetical protein [Trifolium medium]